MRSWLVRALVTSAALAGACRATHPSVVVETGPPGQDGTGYTVQCSGWFPDWIAKTQPANLATTFRLAQGYPLGVPVFVNGPDGTVLDHWDPPAPFTSAPWLAFDFHVPAQQAQYLEALKKYALEDLVPFDFVTQNVPLGKKRWYHVPMMTSGNNPRESQHGLTSERLLQLGLVNGVALDHHNPCLAQIPADQLPSAQKTKAARRAQEQPEEARRSMVQREAFLAPVQLDGRKLARAPEGGRAKAKLATWKELGMELSSEDAENSPHR